MGFLGDDLVDVGGEEGVGFADFGPDGALDGGFDFGLCAGGDAVVGGIIVSWICAMLVPWRGIFATCSFLNMLKCTRVDVVVVWKNDG